MSLYYDPKHFKVVYRNIKWLYRIVCWLVCLQVILGIIYLLCFFNIININLPHKANNNLNSIISPTSVSFIDSLDSTAFFTNLPDFSTPVWLTVTNKSTDNNSDISFTVNGTVVHGTVIKSIPYNNNENGINAYIDIIKTSSQEFSIPLPLGSIEDVQNSKLKLYILGFKSKASTGSAGITITQINSNQEENGHIIQLYGSNYIPGSPIVAVSNKSVEVVGIYITNNIALSIDDVIKLIQ